MKRIVFIFSFVTIQLTAFSQLGVGTNSPDASAQLDVTATDKGFLAPRIALTSATDVTTIASPATGLMIYNTATAGTSPNSVMPGYYYFDGVKWIRFINSAPSSTVSFSTADPNSGSPTFTPNSPQSGDFIYVSTVNSSLWIWNGTAYISYNAPTTTPFYLSGTTSDAGGDKTASIYRTGSIGIGFSASNLISPAANLDVNGTAMFRSGNNSNLFTSNQLIFSHNTSTLYKHVLKTRHNSSGQSGNAFDFYVWNQGIDAIGTNGTKHILTLDGNVRVGIGTTTPLTSLHIFNPLAASQSSNVDAQMLRLHRPQLSGLKWDNIAQFNLGSYSTAGNANSRLDLEMNDLSGITTAQVMTWQANGRVGIGTTAPATNLDVVGGFNLRNIAGAAQTGYGMEFNTNANSPRIDWVFNGAYLGQFSSDANDFLIRNSKQTTGGIRFYTNPTGSSTERLTILNNGNVGVNTISPSSSLHITGVFTEDITSQDNFSNGINIRKRGNSTASTGAVASGAEIGYHSFYGWNGTGYARGAYVFVSAAEAYTSTANGTNYAILTTANGTTSTVERLKIMHNGNVGIGTGNPNGGLTLYGPSSLALPTNIQGATGATKELVFGRGGLFNNFAAITGVDNGQYGGGLSFIVKPTGTNDFPTNAIQAMVLDWNGNMGLGTGSPTQRLDVNGRVRIRTIDTGVATDSVLVVNGGVVKRVSKGASVNIQTANYTLTASDNGNIVIMNSATAVTVTVPATLPAGFVVQIIQKGTGQVTVSGSGSTINSANGFKTRTLNSAIGVVMESAILGYVTGDSNF